MTFADRLDNPLVPLGIVAAGLAFLALTGCTPQQAPPTTAQIVAQGQQAVQAAGGAMTTAASAACLAKSALDIAAPLTGGTAQANLAKADVAAGMSCVWQNPVK